MKTGIIAGNFDIIHPGYVAMFKECKDNCDKFVVLLHTDPSIERPKKLKPIFPHPLLWTYIIKVSNLTTFNISFMYPNIYFHFNNPALIISGTCFIV